MTIDLYTKSILTVIAIALSWLCLSPLIGAETASAQGRPTPVQIIGGAKYGVLEVSADNPLPVVVIQVK